MPTNADTDPNPGEHSSLWDELARLRARVKHLERKAAAANREKEAELQAHREDVAHIFNTALAAELEGVHLPVRVMPDIAAIEVEGLNSMGWKADGVKGWIEERRQGKR